MRPNIDPNNVKALFRRAQVLELQGNFEEALNSINHYEKGPNKTSKDDKTFAALKK